MRRALAARRSSLALVLAGCGDSGPTDEEQVRTTLSDFSKATAAKDYQALCDKILAPSLIADLKKIGLPCEIAMQQGLGDVKQPRLIVGDVKVKGKTATAQVRILGGRRTAVERHDRARAHRRGLADRLAGEPVGARPGALSRISVERGCSAHARPGPALPPLAPAHVVHVRRHGAARCCFAWPPTCRVGPTLAP